MLVVGTEPAAKAWALVKNERTGHFEVGYVPYTASVVEMQKRQLEGQRGLEASIKEHGAEIKELEWIEKKFRRWIGQYNLPNPDFDEESYEKYEASRLAVSERERSLRASERTPLDHTPIFEAILKFDSYSRGRSSVTMNFVAQNGQEVPFGPKATDELISAMLNKEVICDEHGNLKHGGGHLKLRFKFTKQGESIYAFPV